MSPRRAERAVQWLGALLLIAAVGAALWFATLVPTRPQSVATASHGAAASAAPTPSRSLQRHAGPTIVAQPASSPRAATALRPGDVEFCGVGVAAAGSPAAEAMAQRAADESERAGLRLFALMDASPDPRLRAAALLARDERDALARMARLSSDAAVYAMALQACNRGGQERSATCATLDVAQMARLDPDNAVPWLLVTAQALQRKDSAGAAEAMHRASLAQTSLARDQRFAALAFSALPADWPPREAMLASIAVFGLHAAMALPGYQSAAQHCGKDRMQADANLRQTCERLARLLMERGDSLIDYGVGRRIGERAGWPAEAVEANNARYEAYLNAVTQSTMLGNDPADPGDCQAWQRIALQTLAHARDGERAWAQAQVRQEGANDAALIARYRAQAARRAAAAQASGASGLPR